jgi:hypothetical protein
MEALAAEAEGQAPATIASEALAEEMGSVTDITTMWGAEAQDLVERSLFIEPIKLSL